MSIQRDSDERIRDAAVDAAWDAASTEEPTPWSDANILAAARAEARSHPTSHAARQPTPWWIRWQSLAAVAGVACLAFILVQRLPTDTADMEMQKARTPVATAPAKLPESEPASALHAAAEASAPRQSVDVPPQGSSPPEQTPARGTLRGIAELPAARESTEIAVPDVSPPMASQASPRETANRSEDFVMAPGQETATSPARQQAAAISAAKTQSQVGEAEAWTRRIVALHAAGNLAAAAAELQSFRRAYPDADDRLPADLRHWARTVRPED
jgi:hypothetical protein